MSNDLCPSCGLEHGRLAVTITAGVLFREARGSVHRLRLGGGAWAFLASLIDRHLGEIERIQIADVESGMIYHTDIWNFQRHSFRRDLGSGPQIVLPLRYWSTLDTRGGPTDSTIVQPTER